MQSVTAVPARTSRVWWAALLFFAAFYGLLIPLPRHLTAVGLADWQTGLVLGAFGVAGLVGRPLAGEAADAWGRHRVMGAGALALILGAAATPLTGHFLALLALRSLQALGYVLFTTAATAAVADLALPEQGGRAMAAFGAAANLAIAVIPALTNWLLAVLPLRSLFFTFAGLAALAALLAAAVPSINLAGRRAARGGLLQAAALLWRPMATAALFGTGFGTFFQFLPLLTERRDLEPVGLFYTVYGAGIIATRLVAGRLLDTPARDRHLRLAVVSLAAGLAAFGFATTPYTLLAAVLLIAWASGILHPGLIAAHVERLGPGERGRATAAFYLAFDLGIGGGAWLLSGPLQWFGVEGLFLGASLLSAGGLFFGSSRQRQEESGRGAGLAAGPVTLRRKDRPEAYRAVVFDLFHTLVDPEDFRPPEFRRFDEMVRILRLDAGTFRPRWQVLWKELETRPAPGLMETLAALLREEGRKVEPERLAEVDRLFGLYQDRAILNPRPGTVETLRRLAGRGLKIGLLSNADERSVRSWPRSPLAPLFDAACFSYRIGRAKPDPQAYRCVLAELGGVPPLEAVFVGDGGARELPGAREAGFGQVVFMRGFVARNGLHTPEKIKEFEAAADRIIDSLTDL